MRLLVDPLNRERTGQQTEVPLQRREKIIEMGGLEKWFGRPKFEG